MNKHAFASLIMSALVLFGCKKSGCNDMSATNYDHSIEIGDDSCIYEGKVMFVMSNSNYANLGIDTIYVFANGSLLGKQSTNDLFLGTPTCESTNLLVYKKEMKNVVSEVFQYSIRSSNEDIISEGTLNLIRGKCQQIPLY